MNSSTKKLSMPLKLIAIFVSIAMVLSMSNLMAFASEASESQKTSAIEEKNNSVDTSDDSSSGNLSDRGSNNKNQESSGNNESKGRESSKDGAVSNGEAASKGDDANKETNNKGTNTGNNAIEGSSNAGGSSTRNNAGSNGNSGTDANKNNTNKGSEGSQPSSGSSNSSSNGNIAVIEADATAGSFAASLAGETAEVVGTDAFSAFSIAGNKAVATYNFYKTEDTTAKPISTQKLKDKETLQLPAAPHVSGKAFTGWVDASDTSIKIKAGQVRVAGSSKTIDVIPTYKDVFFVTFKDDNRTYYTAEVDPGHALESSQIEAASNSYIPESGKSLVGWSTTKGSASVSIPSTIEKDVTLYPVLKSGIWVVFESNGGTPINPKKADYETNKVSAPEAPVRTGYEFVGWFTELNGGTKVNFNSAFAETTTVYAHWNAKTVNYTVIYWEENADYNNTYLAAADRDPEQYSYWKTTTNSGLAGSLTNVTAAAPATGFKTARIEQKTIAGNGSTIVNVYYDRQSYSVKFHNLVNSSWVEDQGKRITAKYGANIASGWPLNNQGTSQWFVDPAKTVWQANIDTMPAGNVSYYNKKQDAPGTESAYYYVEILPGENFVIETGGVKYKLDHVDTVGKKNGKYVVTDDDKYPITGFTFKNVVSTSSNYYNNAKFYYTRNTHNVNFFNGGKQDKAVSYKFEANISGAGYTPARPAGIDAKAQFKGWFADQAFTKEYDFAGKKMPDRDITVYAKWELPKASVQVHVGMTADSSSKTVKVETGTEYTQEMLWAKILEIDPALEAKASDFLGWFVKDGQAVSPARLPMTIEMDTEFFAKWNTDTYRVTYVDGTDLESGDVPMDQARYTEGSPATVAMPTDGLKAKGFDHWEFDGQSYYPGNTVVVPVGGATLTAAFKNVEVPTVSIAFDTNGAEQQIEDKSGINNSTFVLPTADEVTKEGYELSGWMDSEGNIYEPGESVVVGVEDTIDGTITLTAQWTEIVTEPENPGPGETPTDPTNPSDPGKDPGKDPSEDPKDEPSGQQPTTTLPDGETPTSPAPSTGGSHGGGNKPSGTTGSTGSGSAAGTTGATAVIPAVATPMAAAADGAATQAPETAEIQDDATPMASPEEEQVIADGENALAGFEQDIFCWVHYWIILGMVVTAIYAAAVLIRRKKAINDIDKMEDQILGTGRQTSSNAGASRTMDGVNA